MSDNPLLETVKLSHLLPDGTVIVADISFSLNPGELVAVVGPSGSGKSSLLRLISRLDEATSGTVLLNGQDFRSFAPQLWRRQVSLVMQQAYLFPGTVADNLRFGPAQRGEIVSDAAVASLLNQVGLGGYALRPINNLSGGEAQRVALARTVANNPSIILLDEPTSALDDESEQEVEKLVVAIVAKNQVGCLLVTHDLDQARRLAQRALIMEQGKMAKLGPVAEVIHANTDF